MNPLQVAVGGVINSAAYENGVRVAEVPIIGLPEASQNPNWFLWVGLYEPSEELLRQVQIAFHLHDLAVEDAHKAHQRPKLELYDDSLFLVLRTAHRGEDHRTIEFGETHVFMGKRYLVSVRHGSLASHVGVRARCEATPHLLAKGPGFVLHALMDFIVDQYFPIVEEIEAELSRFEGQIFSGKSERNVTGRIYRLRRDLIALRRVIAPVIDISSSLARYESELIHADTRLHFQNVNDHVLRIAETIDSVQELSKTALEANLALISLSQNDATKRLAAWAAILAVPTLIAGLYGMNFRHMPELDWRYGYPVSMGVMAAICGLLYRGFKKSGWL
jgi:magnesium transporter